MSTEVIGNLNNKICYLQWQFGPKDSDKVSLETFWVLFYICEIYWAFCGVWYTRVHGTDILDWTNRRLGVPVTSEASEICFWTFTEYHGAGSHWNFDDSRSERESLELWRFTYTRILRVPVQLSLSRERVALEQSVFHGRMKHVSEMLFAWTKIAIGIETKKCYLTLTGLFS